MVLDYNQHYPTTNTEPQESSRELTQRLKLPIGVISIEATAEITYIPSEKSLELVRQKIIDITEELEPLERSLAQIEQQIRTQQRVDSERAVIRSLYEPDEDVTYTLSLQIREFYENCQTEILSLQAKIATKQSELQKERGTEIGIYEAILEQEYSL